LKNLLSKSVDKSISLLDIYKISLIKKLEWKHILLENIFKNVLLTAKILKIVINK
jgi:hypothetical protein